MGSSMLIDADYLVGGGQVGVWVVSSLFKSFVVSGLGCVHGGSFSLLLVRGNWWWGGYWWHCWTAFACLLSIISWCLILRFPSPFVSRA